MSDPTNAATPADADFAKVAAENLRDLKAYLNVQLLAATILTKLLTVDGPGSGLNADLLDGLDAAAFALDAAVVKLTGDQTIAGKKIFAGDVDFNDRVTQSVVDLAGGVNMDLAVGNFFYKTVAGATAFTFSNIAAAGRAIGWILEITNGGSAAVTWPAAVKWPFGMAPSLTTAGTDILIFISRDGGVTIRGALVQKDSR